MKNQVNQTYMNRSGIRSAAWTGIFAAVFFFVGCQSTPDKKPLAEAAPADSVWRVVLNATQLANAGIETDTAGRASLPLLLHSTGKVENLPEDRASVSAVYGGYVEQVSVLPGQVVRKGQVLAVLSDPQYVQLGQDYLAARTRLQLAEQELQRLSQLRQQEAASQREVEALRAQVENEQINRNAAAEKLRLAGLDPTQINAGNLSRKVGIASPLSGTVTAVYVNLGKRTSSTDVLFEISGQNAPRMVLQVYEKDLPQLALNQAVNLWQSGAEDRVFKGTVEAIIPAIGVERTAQVRCRITEPGMQLPPGAFLNASIETGRSQGSVLPEEALVRHAGKVYVFREERPGQYRMQAVTTVQTGAGRAVLAALPPGRYVTRGAYTLLMTFKNNQE
jgi:cobalt-zinc-cadmium efflux system membrane fusion protein